MEEKEIQGTEFGNEPNKTVTLLKFAGIVLKLESNEVIPCELPISECRSIPLEIPSENLNQFVHSRFPRAGPNDPADDPEPLTVPVYIGQETYDERAFEELSKNVARTNHGFKIPVVTISAKACGRYDDGRAIQSLGILPIWKDKTTIMLEFDWHEGWTEDYASPEWFIRASPKLPLEHGFEQLKNTAKLHPPAENCSYHLYVNPASLGQHIMGKGQEYPSKIWQREWTFNTREEMLTAIARLAETVESESW